MEGENNKKNKEEEKEHKKGVYLVVVKSDLKEELSHVQYQQRCNVCVLDLASGFPGGSDGE
ncbi:hypothetical protein QJS10_CPB22g00302 [Acorus calamus]|uniref:Uncharacterized protein n=1 Tax=Acorus calamus TaxID=4465 RepID=A0AAV9BZ35_ACOCL|nr:hypothetical protein QJS10_CPB22g00302 [Acorus calamus]